MKIMNQSMFMLVKEYPPPMPQNYGLQKTEVVSLLQMLVIFPKRI